MSFDVLDEHEQGEVVRQWLRQNALSIIVGIVVGLALIFGWQQWKVHELRKSAEAASQYQALVAAVDAKRDDDAAAISAALRKDYSDTPYAVFAAMRQADSAVVKGDNAAAQADLAWANKHAGVPALAALAALRQARVEVGAGDAEAAIKLLDTLPKGEYEAPAADLRGDALVKLGRLDAARGAYEDALAKLDPQAPSRSFVQMKLDDLPADAGKQGS